MQDPRSAFLRFLISKGHSWCECSAWEFTQAQVAFLVYVNEQAQIDALPEMGPNPLSISSSDSRDEIAAKIRLWRGEGGVEEIIDMFNPKR